MYRIDVHQEKGQPFKILKTTERSQLSLMTIPAGQTSINREGHAASDQLLYVVEGRIEATIGDETRELRAGEAVLIPAGTPHRLRTLGRRSATSFNIHSPPAYPHEAEQEERGPLEQKGIEATELAHEHQAT